MLKNMILNNSSSIGVPNDHRKHGGLIIIAEEQGYNELPVKVSLDCRDKLPCSGAQKFMILF